MSTTVFPPASKTNPSKAQRAFFERNVVDAKGTILTVKQTNDDPRGFAVNVRGPFKLVPYFGTETVIDTTWGGDPESKSHLHCCWEEIRYAKFSDTNPAVRKNIKYNYRLAFYASEDDAEKDKPLFWFYLENDDHKAIAVSKLPKDKPIEISTWVA
jgi:hypothetical protein